MAVIRARVDSWKAELEHARVAATDNDGDDDEPDGTQSTTDASPASGDVTGVQLRSPTRRFTNSLHLEKELAGEHPVFDSFDHNLRQFFKRWLPEEYKQLGLGPIKVSARILHTTPR
jgi:hypothetical protein